MFRRIVIYAVLVPLAIVILMFAVANRQVVTVSFDPFSSASPALSFTMPLFVLIFVLVIVGVIVGGTAAWLRQAHYRRAARALQSDIHGLRREVEALNERLAARQASGPQRIPYGPES
jgi:uncharacterized integral membrane protein